jgi:MFS family permease
LAFEYRRSEYLALALGAATGSLVNAAIPLSVGAVITVFGDPTKGGLAVTAEFTAMAIFSLLVGAFLRFLPGRSTALLAGLTLIGGYALSAYATAEVAWPLLLFARVLVGAGEGALFTISNAFAAKSPRPDKTFTLIAFAQVIMNGLFFTLMTFVNETYDPVQVFVVFAVVAAVSCLALFGAPAYRTTADTNEPTTATQERFSPATRRILIGFGLYSVALFALFPYVENIGVNHGFTHSQVAGVLTLSAVATLAGPVVTAMLGLRLGWLVPIMVSIAIQAGACLMLVYCNMLALWGATELLSIAMLYVLTPLMFAFVASIERTGRATAYATAIMAVTAAAGSAVSSFVMAQTTSYAALGWFNALVYVLMAAAIWVPLRAADRARRRGAAPAVDIETAEA